MSNMIAQKGAKGKRLRKRFSDTSKSEVNNKALLEVWFNRSRHISK